MNRHVILTDFIIAVVMCLNMTLTGTAQQSQRPTPESRVEVIDKAVKLTPDQKVQILKIYTDAASDQQGERRRSFFGRGTTEAVEKVLTSDQVKKWRAYTLQLSVDRRITQIDKAVTLTEDQKQKIKPVIETEISARNALFAEMRAQGENADRETMRDKMTEFRSATDKSLESILTKEQLEKYRAMPRGRRRQ